ncbi:hypothetical protein [Nocardia sp. NPDC046763]|uniref:hypothetical protein n=1 Tax=Nocardia sp. NPDC046763 TaxID=3155256 RepID=UPI0033FA18E6
MSRSEDYEAVSAAIMRGARPPRVTQSLTGSYERKAMSRSDTVEPSTIGLYWDRDGDIWQREDAGWRLILQSGIAVDPISLWDWDKGHVCDYAPFTPLKTLSD